MAEIFAFWTAFLLDDGQEGGQFAIEVLGVWGVLAVAGSNSAVLHAGSEGPRRAHVGFGGPLSAFLHETVDLVDVLLSHYFDAVFEGEVLLRFCTDHGFLAVDLLLMQIGCALQAFFLAHQSDLLLLVLQNLFFEYLFNFGEVLLLFGQLGFILARVGLKAVCHGPGGVLVALPLLGKLPVGILQGNSLVKDVFVEFAELLLDVLVAFLLGVEQSRSPGPLEFPLARQLPYLPLLLLLQQHYLLAEAVYLAAVQRQLALVAFAQGYDFVFTHLDFGVFGFEGGSEVGDFLEEEFGFAGVLVPERGNLVFVETVVFFLDPLVLCLPIAFALPQPLL